ncbi:AAA family ATPase [Nocardioides mangrovi]|uniref:Helix-turn-helix transcriptional regulator n=1 Tax=Nocardioides mangrovi TaxID=2874580 RepID=A0ABS7UI57_9ACTN|nr:helix-turn-helix transcriptional regulator [Nocardioides mangrovi]MBZ5740323.1 helix-turn-helix transcriptional regulator [Nocardioides mangrovi]
MARQDRSGGSSAPWSAAACGLLGRGEVLQEVRHRLVEGSRVITVLGGPGAGKTAVVTAAADAARADGWLVLHAHGRTTEAMLGFSALLDLLDAPGAEDHGTVDLVASIRRRVLGSEGTGPTDALRLRRDVHQWLVTLAADRDLLVLLDDVHWLDPASWQVLAFVANRLAQSEVSFLLASRADAAPAGLEDHPVLHLPPLTGAESLELLDATCPGLDPVTRVSILERAAGNPLALLELGRVGAHDALPATVEAAFAADLPALPAETRRLLLLVAAGADDLAVLSRATSAGSVPHQLEPAEHAGLVRVHGTRVVFRHPLVESTVYGLASAAERRAAHGTLADAYAADGDRRIWHRAAAAVAPDEDVAAELMASADRMWMRGAQQEAADAVVRAAELTVDPDLRDERILIGVDMSPAIGHVHKMASVADRFRRHSTHPAVRARSAQVQAYALTQTMQQAAARDMLQRSLEEMIGLDDLAGWASLTSLATLTYRTGQGTGVLARWLQRYEETTLHDPEGHPLQAAAWAWIRAALDPLDPPSELLELFRAAPDHPTGTLPVSDIVVYDVLLGATGWLLDEHAVAVRRLTRAVELMQRADGSRHLAQPLMALGQVQFDLGRYDDADRTGRMLVDISEAEGLWYYRVVGRELRARVTAVRGDHREALRTIDALLAETESGQSASLEAVLMTGRAYALAGMGDHEGAYQDLRSLFGADGDPLHPHVSFLALADLVSAAVRVGRADEVVEVVRRAQGRVGTEPGPRIRRLLARARAQLSADPADADRLFDRAVREPGAADFPFEWASAQLEHGVWLRRQRRAADARGLLRTAQQVFTRIGASAWAAAAEAELRAAGVRSDDLGREPARWPDLTSQEREIVLLAATGLSNKEIGQALFLSPRTVGGHLYHAFPKLGVTSRNQLRDVVSELRED